MIKKRDIKLDIIRIFLVFMVIGTHFFLNSGFYNETVVGFDMYIMCIIRSFLIISFPMVMMLSGYLLSQKKVSKKYYIGIVKTVGVYAICAILYCLFIKLYLKGDMSISIFFEKLLSYQGSAYAWYIEMYIGLFMLIPFLNLIFNNLKSKRHTQLLLLVLFVIVGIPSIINIFNFDSLEWWLKPHISNNYYKILPSWWREFYPIVYYFLGAYLKKYPLKLKTSTNIIILAVIVIVDGTFNFYRSYSVPFIISQWNDCASATIMLISLLTFNLLLKINVKTSKKTDMILKIFSDACIGAILTSCIFDNIFYGILSNLVPIVKDRFLYAPIIVLDIFICSLLLGVLVNIIYKLLYILIIKIINIFKNKVIN